MKNNNEIDIYVLVQYKGLAKLCKDKNGKYITRRLSNGVSYYYNHEFKAIEFKIPISVREYKESNKRILDTFDTIRSMVRNNNTSGHEYFALRCINETESEYLSMIRSVRDNTLNAIKLICKQHLYYSFICRSITNYIFDDTTCIVVTYKEE